MGLAKGHRIGIGVPVTCSGKGRGDAAALRHNDGGLLLVEGQPDLVMPRMIETDPLLEGDTTADRPLGGMVVLVVPVHFVVEEVASPRDPH